MQQVVDADTVVLVEALVLNVFLVVVPNIFPVSTFVFLGKELAACLERSDENSAKARAESSTGASRPKFQPSPRAPPGRAKNQYCQGLWDSYRHSKKNRINRACRRV